MHPKSLVLFLLALLTLIWPISSATADSSVIRQTSFSSSAAAAPTNPIGSGDGRIHVIPALSTPSVKNGGKLTVQAVVKAVAGVARVEAEIEGVATLELKPAAANAGKALPLTVGLYQADWQARGLTDKIYPVTLRVTDLSGHVYTDRSLKFSDPAAGNSTPGSTDYPPDLMQRVGAATGNAGENFRCAVVDATNDYAYLGTGSSPGVVVKVALGSGAAAPTRVGSLTLSSGEDDLASAVIDFANGYAYFGTNTSPGRVVKVALGTGTAAPTRAGAVTLNTGENLLTSAVIDTANGYAYFGTNTSPGRVVRVALGNGAAAPTRANAVTLNAGENLLTCAAVDTTNGYAYFGTNTSPGIVVKVGLPNGGGAPKRQGAVTLTTGENNLKSAVIDPANGYAYFGTNTTPGRVVKVALGAGNNPPTRVNALTLGSGEGPLASAVINTASGYAYFGTDSTPGMVVKVSLGSAASVPTRVSALTLNTGDNALQSAAIDVASGYAYYGTNTNPGLLVKVALDNPELPNRIGSAVGNTGENSFLCSAVDVANGYAYLGTNTTPGMVVKVALGSGANPPARVAALTLNTGENLLTCAVLDAANGYAYFGTNTSPGRVVKVALGAGSAAPTRAGAVTLNTGENLLTSAVIDTANGYAYFGTNTSPGIVVKVALGAGTAAPTRVAALTLNTGENMLASAVINPASRFAYFGTYTSPGIVIKVSLGNGTSAPGRVGALTLNTGENLLASAVIDTANGYAYFGTGTSPGQVVKVTLGSGNNTPTRVGALTLGSGENSLRSAVIGTANSYAWFGTDTSPGIVVKVGLGSGASVPTRLSAITLGSGEDGLACGAIDTANGYAYFGTDTSPGRLAKVALSYKNYAHANLVTMPEKGVINDVRFYSHAAAGNLRLAIYDNSSPHNLLWQSGSVANTTAGDWVVVPITSGTLTSLVLDPGSYWLAWQSDSLADVPSYAAGTYGNGFYLDQTYGSYPATIDTANIHLTSSQWSEYLTYDTAPAAPSNPGVTDLTTSSLNWTWVDNSSCESGFKVWADAGTGPPTTLVTTTAAGATSWTMTTLAANTQYAFQVAATNGAGDSAQTNSYTTWTLIEPVTGLNFTAQKDAIQATPANTISNWQAPLGLSGLCLTNLTTGWTTGWVNSLTTCTGLAPNTSYTFEIKSRNGAGIEAAPFSAGKYTLAADPVAPVLSNPQLTSLDVALGEGDGNPAGTEYAIYCATTGQWVQADGSLGAAAVWATAAAWGTKTVTGLSGASSYSFQARARNGEQVETANGPGALGYTLCTLTYLAGANGSISGTTPQAVTHGADGVAVTAVPAAGYHFVQWSDGSTANPRTDANVTADVSVTAQFTINIYTLSYTAGANGSLTGTTPQTVTYGADGTAITAIPATGYHFVQWSDGSTANPRTDANVTTDVTVTASFAINQYTVVFQTDGTSSATLTGTTPQTVAHGADTTSVTANAPLGYHFTFWSRLGENLGTSNPLTLRAVTASTTLTAHFALTTYTLAYSAGANGSISGMASQVVNYGADGAAVTAVPATGYHFTNWSDGSTVNPRTDTSVTTDVSVTASFAINTYTLTYSAGANGSVSGSSPQTVNYGSDGAAVAAVPATGYHFVQWSDGSTANPRTDANVTADVNVTASFAINTYTLAYTAGANGSISGTTPQTVNYGADGAAVTATPVVGYHFVQWSDGSTANPRTDANVTADVTVTAQFAINTYTLSLSAVHGTVAKAPDQASYDHGATVVLTPSPAAGYKFTGWSGDVPAGHEADNPLNLLLDGNKAITANFAIKTYTLAYAAGANGSISGPTSQTVDYGTDGAAVTAVPATGYHFVQWSDGSTNNPRTDTGVTADVSVTAQFAINTYTLTYSVDANGSVLGSSPQTVNYGSDGAAVTAVPAVGYHFVQWSDGSAANPRTDMNVTADVTVTASFAINTYTLTYTAGPNGSISGTTPQSVNYGADGAAVNAVSAAGYHFVQWSDGSTANPRTDANITTDVTVTASFTINQYTVVFQTDGTPGATLTGASPQTIEHGADATSVTANAPLGYHFTLWSRLGENLGTSNPLTLRTVTAPTTLTAHFALTTYTLAYTAGANGSISGTALQVVNYGADGTAVTAVPATGYHFTNWSDGSTANPRTDASVTADVSVTASFAIDQYTLSYTAGVNGSISGTTPQTVNYGTDGAAVTAVPATGYHFVQWNDGSTANPRMDTNVTADVSVSSSFAINTYTLVYTAGANGSILGSATQSVNHGSDGVAVTAVPAVGYHFVQWSDGSTANPRTDTNVTADVSVTASFAINTYTLAYTAGANGSLTGTTPQTVIYGADGTAITAIPATGYHFVQWSDGSTANPRTDATVTTDVTVSASFAINQYTVVFQTDGTAGATLTGASPQTVEHGADATSVTANAPLGYHFTLWSRLGENLGTSNPLTLRAVTASTTLTAHFAITTCTLAYTTGANGSISGTALQVVNYGADGTAITAVPVAGYHFTSWSDGSTANPRTDTSVTTDVSVTAQFAINTYTLTYSAGANGSISGTTPQTVNYGADGAAVTATPAVGYHFVQWSDGSTANPRTDANVTADVNVTAQFAINQYTVIFQTDGTPGATLTGSTLQTINHGDAGTTVTANAPAGYQFLKWTRAGVDYATANPLRVTNVTETMILTAAFGQLPFITLQPLGRVVDPGSAVDFIVGAGGTAPLHYQWRKDGASLTDTLARTGSSSTTLHLNAVAESDEGSYDCLVTNSAGQVVSNAAALLVNDPPVITSQPASLTLNAGATAVFDVQARGAEPLQYCWEKDGTPLNNTTRISGATRSTLTITNLLASDAGLYRCVVSNAAGTTSSLPARLTVNEAEGWKLATPALPWGPRWGFASAVFQNKLWIFGGSVMGDRNDIWSTSDGVNWTQAANSAAWSPRNDHAVVLFNGQLYLLGGVGNSDVWRSSDGVNWTQLANTAPWGPREEMSVVVLNGKLWVVGGSKSDTNQEQNDVWSSSDGVTWTQETSAAPWAARTDMRVEALGSRMYILGGINYHAGVSYNDVWSSSDGANWRQETGSAPWMARYEMASTVIENKLWIMGGRGTGGNTFLRDAWFSSDGVNWTQSTAPVNWSARADMNAAAFLGSIFLFGGEGAAAINDSWYLPIVSQAGMLVTPDANCSLSGRAGGPFPPDGFTYTVTNTGTESLIWTATQTAGWVTLSKNGGTLAPGASSTVVVTVSAAGNALAPGAYQDVITFTNTTTGQGNTTRGVGLTVFPDTDPSGWTLVQPAAAFPPRQAHTALAFGGKLWVIGGFNGSRNLNDVWTSVNGATWSRMTGAAAFSPRQHHSSLVFNNRMWVIGGDDGSKPLNDVWSSADGIVWTRATGAAAFEARMAHSSVVFGGRMWVIGGYNGTDYFGDVWSSTDGVTWTQAAAAAFPPRGHHASAVFNNRIVTIAGSGGIASNEAWSSAEGTTWTLSMVQPITPRDDHACVVFGNKLWVTAGSAPELTRDVWTSDDGSTWVKLGRPAAFPARADHASVVFSGRLWVIGGLGEGGGQLNDVWSYGLGAAASPEAWAKYQ